MLCWLRAVQVGTGRNERRICVVSDRALKTADCKGDKGNVAAGSYAEDVSNIRSEEYYVLVRRGLYIERLIFSSAVISNFYSFNRGVVCEWDCCLGRPVRRSPMKCYTSVGR